MSAASSTPHDLRSATRTLNPALIKLLHELKPGDRIRVRQRVRVGSSGEWPAETEGTFRSVNYLATGLATDRAPEDDIVVITVHFTKKNGELSSITLDEHGKIEPIKG
jgi:hypothetical protein